MTPDKLLEIAKTLKPCPWCGHRPKIVAIRQWFSIECHNDDCGMRTVRTYSHLDPARAGADWNEQGEMKPTDNSSDAESVTPSGNEPDDELKAWARCGRKARRSFIEADMRPKPNLRHESEAGDE